MSHVLTKFYIKFVQKWIFQSIIYLLGWLFVPGHNFTLNIKKKISREYFQHANDNMIKIYIHLQM